MSHHEHTWTIVEFDDHSVEAIPSIWIQGDVCFWPPYTRQRLALAIRRHEDLNTCWQSHHIKVFRNATFDNYITARNKARKAEDTSDLCSEYEQKRKKIPKMLSSSSEEEDESSSSRIPSPPVYRKKRTEPKKVVLHPQFPSADRPGSSSQHDNNRERDIPEENNLVVLHPQFPSEGRPGSSSQYDNNRERGIPEENNFVVLHPQFPLEDRPGSSSQYDNYRERDIPEENNIGESAAVCQSCCVQMQKQEKNINILLSQNHLLRSLSCDILKEISELKNQLANKHQTDQVRASIFNTAGVEFPVDTEGDLHILEDVLTDELTFTSAVVEISKLGGANGYDLIKRALSLLVSNNLAEKFSFFGRKGKKPFNNLNLARVLIAAADKAGLVSSQKEAENLIQSWLKRAKERQAAKQNKKF